MKHIGWLAIIGVWLLCGMSFGDEPHVVKNAREKCVSQEKDALQTYDRTMAAAEGKKLEQLRAALQKAREPELLTALAAEVKDATETNAFYQALLTGAATFKVLANGPWQPTIKVKTGMVVQVWGEGYWCSDIKKRQTHTYDADGEAGHDFAYLAVRIGTGRSERVGKYRCFTIYDDGDLSFEMHDSGKSDNDGALTVTIQVMPPTEFGTLSGEAKDALLAYYKAMAGAQENMMKDLAQALVQTRDATVITAITQQLNHARESLVFFDAMINGTDGVKVDAAKSWQPAMHVAKGATVHVYATGVWCSDTRDRPGHTFDAEGQLGKDFAYLQGRIGEGPAFRIGRSQTFKATEDGDLSFEMHDSGKGDNDGTLTVYISVENPGGFHLEELSK